MCYSRLKLAVVGGYMCAVSVVVGRVGHCQRRPSTGPEPWDPGRCRHAAATCDVPGLGRFLCWGDYYSASALLLMLYPPMDVDEHPSQASPDGRCPSRSSSVATLGGSSTRMEHKDRSPLPWRRRGTPCSLRTAIPLRTPLSLDPPLKYLSVVSALLIRLFAVRA
jgi:hypothetical protein